MSEADQTLSSGKPTYRVIKPLAAFDPAQKYAFTIPSGSLIEKDESFAKFGLVKIEWGEQTVLAEVQDLIECIEPG
jgi:hypothetical protein